MSKKKFNAGLDSIFAEAPLEQVRVGVGSAFLMGDAEAAVEVKTVEPRKIATTKNFLSDLDSLLNEALAESIDDYNRGETRPSSSKSKSSNEAPVGSSGGGGKMLAGLDALIRQTIDVNTLDLDDTGKKRVTFSVDRSKLDKLKLIARLEKTYIKDLLSALIDEHITEYVQKKGIDI